MHVWPVPSQLSQVPNSFPLFFWGSLKAELEVNTWRRKSSGKINIKREKAGSMRQPKRKNARDSSCWWKISSDTPTSVSLCCIWTQAYSYSTGYSPTSESLALVGMLAAQVSELLGNCPLWLRLKINTCGGAGGLSNLLTDPGRGNSILDHVLLK